MITRRAVSRTLLTLCVLAASSSSAADPINIISGTATITRDLSSGSIAVVGDGLQVTSVGTGGVTVNIVQGSGGMTVNLDGVIGSNAFYHRSITIGGTTLSIPGFTGPV